MSDKRKPKNWGKLGFTPRTPWENDESATVFPSLAKRYGTAYALRMYGYAEQLATITGDTEHTEEWRQEALGLFSDWMKREHAEDCAGFARFLTLIRALRFHGAFKASSRFVGGSREYLRPLRRTPLQIRRLPTTST